MLFLNIKVTSLHIFYVIQFIFSHFFYLVNFLGVVTKSNKKMSSSENSSVGSNEDPDAGFTLLFDKEISYELPSEGQEEEDSETVKSGKVNVQVHIKQNDDNLEAVRLRFLSKDDIRYLYEKVYDSEEFESIKEGQELNIEFNDFPNALEEVLEQVTEDGEEGYKAVMIQNEEEEKAELVLQQDLDLCTTDIFKFELEACPRERVEKISQERYNELCKQYDEIATKYKDMIKRIKRQDPKILSTFKTSTALQ